MKFTTKINPKDVYVYSWLGGDGREARIEWDYDIVNDESAGLRVRFRVLSCEIDVERPILDAKGDAIGAESVTIVPKTIEISAGTCDLENGTLPYEIEYYTYQRKAIITFA